MYDITLCDNSRCSRKMRCLRFQRFCRFMQERTPEKPAAVITGNDNDCKLYIDCEILNPKNNEQDR